MSPDMRLGHTAVMPLLLLLFFQKDLTTPCPTRVSTNLPIFSSTIPVPCSRARTILIEAIDVPHAFTKALIQPGGSGGRPAAGHAQEQRDQPRPDAGRHARAMGHDRRSRTVCRWRTCIATSAPAAMPTSPSSPMSRPTNRSFTSKPSGSGCITTSASRKPAGWCCAGPAPRWPRWPR